MTRWILVRHAQSTSNADGTLAGHRDVELSLRGWQQALSLARLLRGERIGRVVSSDLRRAMDTAAAAMTERALGLRTSPLLRERHLGDWTGHTYAALHHDGRALALNHLHVRPPGGESLADVALRAVRFLERVDDGRPTLVVAHGGLLRAVLGLVDETPPERLGAGYIANAEPHVRELPTGYWSGLRARLEAW